jgi:hypothetical protein
VFHALSIVINIKAEKTLKISGEIEAVEVVGNKNNVYSLSSRNYALIDPRECAGVPQVLLVWVFFIFPPNKANTLFKFKLNLSVPAN